MSNGPSIIAELGLKKGTFKQEVERIRDDLKPARQAATEMAGAIALLERQLSSGNGAAAQKQQLSALKAEYRDATREIKLMEAQQRNLQSAMGGGGLHGGNRQELMHSARAIVDMLAAGQSPLRALEVEAPRIIQGLGLGLESLVKYAGPLAAAFGVYELGKALHKAHEEAVSLNEELDKSGRPFASLGGAQIKPLEKRLDESGKQVGDIQTKVDAPIGNFFSNLTTGIVDRVRPAMSKVGDFLNLSTFGGFGGAINFRGLTPDKGQSREDALKIAQQQQAEELSRLVKAHTRDFSVEELSASKGKDVAEPERLKREYQSLRDEIERMVASSPGLSDHGLLAELDKEFELRKKIAGVQHEQIKARYELAHAQTEIHLNGESEDFGSDVHTKTVDEARAKVASARTELSNVQGAGLDDREAKKNLDDALRTQYDIVHAAVMERDARKAVSEEIELQAKGQSAEAARRAVVASFEERIAKARVAGDADAVSDLEKQRGPALDVADVHVEENKIAIEERGVRLGARGLRGARGSHTPDEMIDQGEKLIALAEKRRAIYDNLAAKNGGVLGTTEQSEYDANEEKLKGIRAAVDSIREARAKDLREAKALTQEMELQAKGDKSAATEARIRVGYEERIAKALKDGNAELAGQLQKQQSLSLLEHAVDEAVKSPEQRASEAAERHKRDFARGQILNLQKRHEEAQSANSSMDPMGDAPRISDNDPIPDHLPGGPQHMAPPQHMVLPDRRGTLTADPQSKQVTGAGRNDGGIVKAVNDVQTAIEKNCSFKNVS